VIDISAENLITFSTAAKLRPPSRGGRPTHTSTIWRWASRGIRGVRLETIRLGAVTYTSVEALQRFGNRLSANSKSDVPPNTRRTKSTDAALDEHGF
jgi:hypothetical protein